MKYEQLLTGISLFLGAHKTPAQNEITQNEPTKHT